MKSKVDEEYQKKKFFVNLSASGQSSKLGLIKVCIGVDNEVFFFSLLMVV
jgi:hypothetical protein